MKKGLTELVFILDRSGSMHGLERDTIGGFNSMLDKQRRAEGQALVSTVLFDNESEVIHDRVDLRRDGDGSCRFRVCHHAIWPPWMRILWLCGHYSTGGRVFEAICGA